MGLFDKLREPVVLKEERIKCQYFIYRICTLDTKTSCAMTIDLLPTSTICRLS